MNSIVISRNNKFLKKLELFLKSDDLSFSEMKGIIKPGVYGIIIEGTASYIGKTTRSGKTRITELAADYRSHTLNRKLFKDYLESKLSHNLDKFNKGTKSMLIRSGVVSEIEFIEAQKVVNTQVREEFQFKFIELDSDEITSFEHFAISLLKPKYND